MNSSLLTLLQTELSRRIEKNTSYSLRSFARSLEVDPSYLSKILNGKRVLSYSLAVQICEKLKIERNLAEPYRVVFHWSKKESTQQAMLRIRCDVKSLPVLRQKLAELSNLIPDLKWELLDDTEV